MTIDASGRDAVMHPADDDDDDDDDGDGDNDDTNSCDDELQYKDRQVWMRIEFMVRMRMVIIMGVWVWLGDLMSTIRIPEKLS